MSLYSPLRHKFLICQMGIQIWDLMKVSVETLIRNVYCVSVYVIPKSSQELEENTKLKFILGKNVSGFWWSMPINLTLTLYKVGLTISVPERMMSSIPPGSSCRVWNLHHYSLSSEPKDPVYWFYAEINGPPDSLGRQCRGEDKVSGPEGKDFCSRSTTYHLFHPPTFFYSSTPFSLFSHL